MIVVAAAMAAQGSPVQAAVQENASLEVTATPSGGQGQGYGAEYEMERRPDVYVFGFIQEGSMMVPVRPVAETFGATVHWVAGLGTLVNGHLVRTVTVLGQAYSPARELAQVLGCWLEWNQAARAVTLSNGIQRLVASVPQMSWEDGSALSPVAGESGSDLQTVNAPVVTIMSTSVGGAGAGGSAGQGLQDAKTGAELAVVTITTLHEGRGAPPGGDAGTHAGTSGTGDGQEAPAPAGKIALTFDDGPDEVYTKEILDVLERHHVKATFFLIGSQAERHQGVVRQIASAGHELGNHGYSHSRLTTLSLEAARREIARTQEVIKAATNITPAWFRPPYGSYNEEIQRTARAEGAATVLWTLNPDDWRSPGQAVIVQRVVSAARDGAIVLLHVRAQTARALPTLIEELRARGFALVRLSDILSPGGKEEPQRRPGSPVDPDKAR